MKILFKYKLIFFFLFILFYIQSVSFSQPFQNGAISSAHKLATEVGINILKNGGNAVDAAVGVGFALSVVYPQAGNLGGGGFLVLSLKSGKQISIDFREKAPLSSYPEMYLDAEGNVIEGLSTYGHLSVGVPGSVAGLIYSLEHYGTMKIYDVIKYSIDLAENGFILDKELYELLKNHRKEFNNFRGGKKTFGRSGIQIGMKYKQPQLANTLKEISEKGKDGFYKGSVADKIISEMQYGNGIITYEDLNKYNVIERDVIKGNYRGFEIISMPLPSSGGICLIELLNILELFDLQTYSVDSFERVHTMIEAMRRVYADRSEFLGDADFVGVPVDILTSKIYAKKRMKDFNPLVSSKSEEIFPGDAYYREGQNTTHFSVVDKDGNCVSVTTTLNDNFGSKVVVYGAGFLLNNEMDDFSIKPGTPNLFGLTGNKANEIQPEKRPLSSMTPTIILKENNPFLVIGSPGGGKIITSVLQTIINIIDFNMDLSSAIDFSRFHHQWYPDIVYCENNFVSDITMKKLTDAGHILKNIYSIGRIDAVIITPNGYIAHSDKRGYGFGSGF